MCINFIILFYNIIYSLDLEYLHNPKKRILLLSETKTLNNQEDFFAKYNVAHTQSNQSNHPNQSHNNMNINEGNSNNVSVLRTRPLTGKSARSVSSTIKPFNLRSSCTPSVSVSRRIQLESTKKKLNSSFVEEPNQIESNFF